MAMSEESRQLAEKLVSDAIHDNCWTNKDVMIARIASALDASWQQGLADLETWKRVQSIITGGK